jgi:hypothetical protein
VEQEVALVARERWWAVVGAALSSQKRNRGGSKVGCIQGLFCNYRKYRDLSVK